MPEDTVFISRLTEDLPSQDRPGHVHKKHTEFAPIHRVGSSDRWLIEIRTEGAAGPWWEQLEIAKGQGEIAEVPDTFEGESY
jgi:hypothetical protein